jgi:hypothetical protein
MGWKGGLPQEPLDGSDTSRVEATTPDPEEAQDSDHVGQATLEQDGTANGDARTVPSPDRRQTMAPKRVTERHFCRYCLPQGRPHDPEIVAATSEIALGGLIAIWSPWVGGLLAAVGTLRVGWRLVAARRRRRLVPPPPTALFLDPRIAKLELTETLRGSQRRRGGRCEALVTSASGKVEMEAVWSRTHTAAVEEHRQKQDLQTAAEVTFSAGSLVVSGPGRLGFATRKANGAAAMVLPLRSVAADHQVLADVAGRGDPRWTHTIEYTVDAPAPGSSMPVWITPSLSPGSGGRALELDVHWRLTDPMDPTADRAAPPLAEQIEELRLSVPAAWGEVENYGGAEQLTMSDAVDGRRDIVWERADPKILPSERGRCHLSVAFQRRIVDDREPDVAPVVHGTLKMAFAKALSGAAGVQVHAAGGARRMDGASRRCKIRTNVELDIHMDLSDLRYQDVRTVPDPVRDGSEQHNERRKFPGVVPDHQTVALLTDVLSDQGYYVKTVVENPAQAGREPRTFDRFWDVTGRWYNGVHPINFHMVITGEEVRQGVPGRASSTTVRLTVWGTYATDDMEQDIVAEHVQLWDRIRACLDPTGRAPGEPVDAAAAEVARIRNAAQTLRVRLRAARESGEPSEKLIPGLVRFVDDEFGLPAPESNR